MSEDYLTNAEIYHLWLNGRCRCGARKYQRQPFCFECYEDVSPETKKRLQLKRGAGFETAFRDAWNERNGIYA